MRDARLVLVDGAGAASPMAARKIERVCGNQNACGDGDGTNENICLSARQLMFDADATPDV